MALNSIWRRLPRGKIEVDSTRVVVDGILDAVGQAVHSIKEVRKASWPNVDVYCVNIGPRLPSTFSRFDFKMIYKSIERNLNAEEKCSADDALDTLIGIGAIGLLM